MTSTRNILVIGVTLILVLKSESFARTIYRSKRSNEFILRRCIASAELIKTHLTEINKTRSILPDIGKDKINETSTIQRNNKRIKSHNNDQQYLISSNVEDTPLKTVNIFAVIKDKPLIFQKKNLLPELQHNTLNKPFKIPTNVITIKS
ncbi:hypothetical protein M0802_013581 [Mischocyttarus mexicanus]|nr:hypothetical protein M0802_013581 [Mischocyttarus mexicanus]